MKKKISVGILGATGSVGQRFIQLLADHPWFEITALAASEKSAGKSYGQAANWLMATSIPQKIRDMKVELCTPNLPCEIVFSALDSSIAGDVEENFAKAGYIVHSNARNFRMHPSVPLLISEVNPEHLSLLESQKFPKGKIITNGNCSVIGLSLALKPLHDAFGLDCVTVVTMQAISGAGYPGVASLDIMDNVIPYISGEEEKMETEIHKILGKVKNGKIEPTSFKISAQCNRVPVSDGHTECVSVKFKNKPKKEEIIKVWEKFRSKPQELNLPLAPLSPIHYLEEEFFPQPKLHRQLDKGMAVTIGRLRECPVFDYKFVILSHNTIRGAAGGAILNAELLYEMKKGL